MACETEPVLWARSFLDKNGAQTGACRWKNHSPLPTTVVIGVHSEDVKRFSLQAYSFFRAIMAALTPEANRAARAILKWSVRELAEKAGIAFSTVHRFETTGSATEATKEKIKAAYAAHGVEITNGDYTGARLRLKRDR
ncbi:conserved hypothetical protein [Rhizobium mesoamericanum STM3625]|uniref:HTH cro/C1-type domain-containing protein n=2 Tax=Rhizobium mesoamericanum TaxID=1079800 RepID=K0PSC9_9HYPH|nr:conserved hypothetical protein [Rhizobium mesoamericanum STM3625]